VAEQIPTGLDPVGAVMPLAGIAGLKIDLKEGAHGLHLDFFGKVEGFPLIDAQIVGGAADVFVAKQLAAGRKVLRGGIDGGGFRAAHGVGAVTPGIEPGIVGPFFHEIGILVAAYWLAVIAVAQTREHELIMRLADEIDPCLERFASREQELHDVWLASLFLPDRKLLDDHAGMIAHIDDAQLEKIGSAQHRIDAGVEQREVAQRGMGLTAQLLGRLLTRHGKLRNLVGQRLEFVGESGAHEIGLSRGKGGHLADRLVLVPGLIPDCGFSAFPHNSHNTPSRIGCKALFCFMFRLWLLSKAVIDLGRGGRSALLLLKLLCCHFLSKSYFVAG